MLIDTHAHLTDARFEGEVDEIIKLSHDCTVEKIITSGADLLTSQKAVVLAEKYDNVFASVGVHPQDAENYDEDVEKEIEKLTQSKKVVAIGEIGLEYRDGCPDSEIQKEVFIRQIKLANRLGLPIVIHTRDAIADTLEIVKTYKHLIRGGTFHCFSESKEVAEEVLKLGFYISVGGVSTFNNAKKVKEALSVVPLEKIILETDCPYLAPEPFRGTRNDPHLVPYIAENLAKLKGVNVEEVTRITTENARRLFKI